MLINEVCRKCNLTKKAIEYYGEHGLIRPAVLKNGYRNFSEADVAKLKRIAVLRGLDLSVSEIRTVLEKDSLSSMYDFFYKKELKIADLQTKKMLIKQLADGEDWDNIRKQVEALQKKQSILNRILDKFPGYYGKFVCSHFSLFLDEPITSKEQQDAFETIITFLDDVAITLPEDLQEYLDEIMRLADASITQNAASALVAAVENPEQYINDNKEMLEQYRTVLESDEYKASPIHRMKEFLRQLQSENGYNDIFIPAMQRLSPSYREYYNALQIANKFFSRYYRQNE